MFLFIQLFTCEGEIKPKRYVLGYYEREPFPLQTTKINKQLIYIPYFSG